MSDLPFGRHRSKINALQTVSEDTRAHIDSIDMTRVCSWPR